MFRVFIFSMAIFSSLYSQNIVPKNLDINAELEKVQKKIAPSRDEYDDRLAKNLSMMGMKDVTSLQKIKEQIALFLKNCVLDFAPRPDDVTKIYPGCRLDPKNVQLNNYIYDLRKKYNEKSDGHHYSNIELRKLINMIVNGQLNLTDNKSRTQLLDQYKKEDVPLEGLATSLGAYFYQWQRQQNVLVYEKITSQSITRGYQKTLSPRIFAGFILIDLATSASGEGGDSIVITGCQTRELEFMKQYIDAIERNIDPPKLDSRPIPARCEIKEYLDRYLTIKYETLLRSDGNILDYFLARLSRIFIHV